MSQVPGPERGGATAADAGRSCPYCRFPIKAGTQVAVCGVCRAPHHGECWEENGGCAVVACAAGPRAEGSQPAHVPAAPDPEHQVERTRAYPPVGPPPARGRSWLWILLAGAIVVAAVGGGTAAFLLSRHKQPEAITTSTIPRIQTVTTVKIQTVKARTPTVTRPKPKPKRKKAVLPVRGSGRYGVAACGGIVDRSTRLEWFVGPDENTTWPGAASWAANLTACGGGWSLPTSSELEGLFDASLSAGTGYFTRGRYYPARISPVFNGIGGGSWVWTDEAASASGAYAINLYEDLRVTLGKTEVVYPVRAFAIKPAP